MVDDLKHILKGLDIPAPSVEAKDRAMQMARQAFEEEQEKKRKGTTKIVRPILSESILTTWIRRFEMKKAYAFAGSFAAVAVVLAVTTSHYSTIMGSITQTPVPTTEEGKKDVRMPAVAAAKNPQPMDPATLPEEVEDDKSNVISTANKEKEGMLDEKNSAIDLEAPGMTEGLAESASPPASVLTKTESQSDQYANRRKSSASKAMKQHPIRAQERIASNMPAPGISAADAVGYGSVMPHPVPPQYYGGDKFEQTKANAAKHVADEPVSTFSIDVDTASYSFVRRMLNQGQLPQPAMVRVEEMVNYFYYNYPVPEAGSHPFKPSITVAPSPWNSAKKLVHIGIKGYELPQDKRPPANLVFLIDVSGSMNSHDKLPLLKSSLHMLVDQMSENDTISIVTYAGRAGTALSPTRGSDKQTIRAVIDQLGAGGGTAGAAGIEQAYNLAQQQFGKDSVNRVILATDGDFNVGMSNNEQLKQYIVQKREAGISLSVLGFGQGNYNDALMQSLAQNGNGNAAYIDSLNEARKVLVNEMSSTLFTIAKDVKLQVEWNPALVSEYRLVGYETRLLNREDFNNDKVDAGEVGAGHAVTAIYEITPKGAKGTVDDLRYQNNVAVKEERTHASLNEYGFLKIRYKQPKGTESTLMTTPITTGLEVASIEQAPADTRFATAVAGFGQLLKQDPSVTGTNYDAVIALADGARGNDPHGLRGEFVNLVRTAKSLQSGMYPVYNEQAPGMHRCGSGTRC